MVLNRRKLRKAVKAKNIKKVLRIISEQHTKPFNFSNFDIVPFAKMRQKYFDQLIDTIRLYPLKNLDVSYKEVEELALKCEQPALLASIQLLFYQKVMQTIISSFKTSSGNLPAEVKTEIDSFLRKHSAIKSFDNDIFTTYKNKATTLLSGSQDVVAKPSSPLGSCSKNTIYPSKTNFPPVNGHPEDFLLPESDFSPADSYSEDILPSNTTILSLDTPTVHLNDHTQSNKEIVQPKVLENIEEKSPMQVPVSNIPLPKPEELFPTENSDLFDNLEKDLLALHSGTYKKSTKSNETLSMTAEGLKTFQLWQKERYIFAHKLYENSAKLSTQRYAKTRSQFLDLFGWDSDDEHESEYTCANKFLDCCVQRIAPLIVRHLMPYYKQKRIGGHFIFKNLVCRIAESLVERKDYPDDWDVKKFVVKFFPEGQKFVHINDVWCFVVSDNDFL